MKNIDLFIGVFPGGTSFYDKSVYNNGDYKQLAFVRAYGQINYSVKPEKLPDDIRAKIEQESRDYKRKFEEDTRRAWKLDRIDTYSRLLDYLPFEDCKAVFDEKDDTKKLDLIIKAYERPRDYEVTA